MVRHKLITVCGNPDARKTSSSFHWVPLHRAKRILLKMSFQGLGNPSAAAPLFTNYRSAAVKSILRAGHTSGSYPIANLSRSGQIRSARPHLSAALMDSSP
jgi:hypothetical protein